MMRVGFLIIVGFWGAFVAEAEALSSAPHRSQAELVYWNKTPVALTLRVGSERLVHFPKPGQVKVGVPEHLDETVLRTQVLDNTVYWLAKQPFETERVQVMNLASGEIFLFDLMAKPEGDVVPIEIVSTVSSNPVVLGAESDAAGKKSFDYVALTRFAAEQMYAPKRLLQEKPGMVRVPVPNESVPLVRGGKVEALPLISWRGGGATISVVRLRNMTKEAVTLDPRNLRGDWLAATFQHARLLPMWKEADTTCVYLISEQSFEVAMAPFLKEPL
ncbi:MAG: TIGR03749 family integrating conjugative element protein [Gammaproteobacteria bacterium]|nr:TIGR03749 family integrating conjugative element protein [Gammaproteobacteria bacterium]